MTGLFYSLLLLMGVGAQFAHSQELISTGWVCAGQSVYLTCRQPSEMIVLTRTQHKRSDAHFCPFSQDFESNLLTSLMPLMPDPFASVDCLSTRTRDNELEAECNGRHSCLVNVEYEFHLPGKASNCNFMSNMQNIFYTCLPSRKFIINNSIHFNIDYFGSWHPRTKKLGLKHF